MYTYAYVNVLHIHLPISSSPLLVLRQFPRHWQRGIKTDLSCPPSTPLNAYTCMPMNACTHTSPHLLISSACSSAVPKAPGALCCFGFVEVGEILSCHACVSSWVTCKCVCRCRFLSHLCLFLANQQVFVVHSCAGSRLACKSAIICCMEHCKY